MTPHGLPMHQHFTMLGAVDCHAADCDVYQIQLRARAERVVVEVDCEDGCGATFPVEF